MKQARKALRWRQLEEGSQRGAQARLSWGLACGIRLNSSVPHGGSVFLTTNRWFPMQMRKAVGANFSGKRDAFSPLSR